MEEESGWWRRRRRRETTRSFNSTGCFVGGETFVSDRTFVCLCFVLCCVVFCYVMFLLLAARATYLPVPLRSGVPTPTAPPPPRGRVTDPSGHPIRLSIPPFDPAARPAVFPMDHIYVYIYIYIYLDNSPIDLYYNNTLYTIYIYLYIYSGIRLDT